MTGSWQARWSFLHNVVVPAALVTVESTWAAALLFALARSHGSVHRDVPFLALAVPATLAAAAVGMERRRPSRLRLTAAIGSLVAIWLVTAIAYDAGVLGGSVLDVLHPWRLSGGTATSSALCLFVCGAATARGATAARKAVSMTEASASVLIGAVVVTLLLVSAAAHHSPFFSALGAMTTDLLLLGAPLAVAVLALVRERALEQDRSTRTVRAPRSASLLAVAVPAAIAVGVGIGTVAVLALVAPPIGHGVAAAARQLGHGIGVLLGLIARHAPTLKVHPHLRATSVPAAPPLSGARSRPSASTPVWLGVLVWSAVAVVAGTLLVVAVRLAWRLLSRRRHHADDAADDEVRESVFSLRHLLAQVRRLLAARVNRPRAAPAASSAGHDVEGAAASVRGEYRRLLHGVRAAGKGRRLDETPLELAGRLAGETSRCDRGALDELTSLYDAVRYAQRPEPDDGVARAAMLVDRLVATLSEEGGDEEASVPLPH